MRGIIGKLNREKELSKEEWTYLIENFSYEDGEYAKGLADEIRRETFGNKVYIRGLIEISSYCKNNCLYCGIRAGNKNAQRYRLSKEEIISSCRVGFPLGFRSFVLQGGEDGNFSDDFVCDIVSGIKKEFPDCAVTLSLGERSYESYKRLKEAGADRYLLRHEAASEELYKKLHPEEMSYQKRMECLCNLKKLGYQTGCGFMVGAPYQTSKDLAEDMIFMKDFEPHMIGIGPYMSQHDTPFKDFKNGSADLTVFLLSLIRIMMPKVLLPATTALASLSEDGRIRGISAGANVVMPNLSPCDVREKYSLYDNKKAFNSEAAEGLWELKEQMKNAGYHIVTDRGDYPDYIRKDV